MMISNQKIYHIFITAVLICIFPYSHGLKVVSKDLEGTSSGEGLSDKQLAFQRWFASLTILQDTNSWNGWGDAINDVDCDGNTCIRYEIAGLAYSVALIASKTPAYTQLSEIMMLNAIQRMTQQVVYQYIELFPNFQEQPSYPDPVAYKNIMYSGHLAQMIMMYESIFHNDTFSTIGWDFKWQNIATNTTTTLHYNTSLLLQRVFDQSREYKIGGVPCEPDSIFVICNNYPQNAWLLSDHLHDTNYTTTSIDTWYESVHRHGVNRQLDTWVENYFKLDYLIQPLGIWEPIGSIGSDMWGLAWMKPWWPLEGMKVLTDAFDWIYNSPTWVYTPASSPTTTIEKLTPQAFLQPGQGGQKLFPFDAFITTSFYPMIEKQFRTSSSSTADAASSKIDDVLRYFESHYGRWFDSDADGVLDSYQYNSQAKHCDDPSSQSSHYSNSNSDSASNKVECSTGSYSIWATANLLLGMVYPENDPNYLRRLFHPVIMSDEESAVKRAEQETGMSKGGVLPSTVLASSLANIAEVEYPHVMVSYAQVTFLHEQKKEEDHKTPMKQMYNLTAILRPGDNAPLDRTHQVTIGNIPCEKLVTMMVSIDGQVVSKYMIHHDVNDTEKCYIPLTVHGWTKESIETNESIHVEVLY